MRAADHAEIEVWSGVMIGRILFGESPLDLIEAYSEYAGRMCRLPDWIHGGAIVAVQGGQQAARTTLDEARRADIPLASLWIQDWVGARLTSSGRQIWWNWRLDQTYYPQWSELVADLESRGARMLIYINPFLGDAEGHEGFFNAARAGGYLVQKSDGSPISSGTPTSPRD
jgi:alpha-glucosidase